MKLYKLIILIMLGMALLINCAGDSDSTSVDPEASSNLVDDANAALEQVLYDLINNDSIQHPSEIDFTTPYELYRQAYQKDPSNPDANFGLGLTSILMTTQDQQLQQVWDEWSDYFDTNNPFEAPLGDTQGALKLGFPTSEDYYEIPTDVIAKTAVNANWLAIKDAPKLSDIQNVLENLLLPKLDFALQAMDQIDNNENFVFKITPKMQGDLLEDTLEVDLTEIYALEVSLNVLKAVTDIIVSYDVDFTDFDSAGIMEAFDQSGDFLTLRDNGSFMNDAKDCVMDAVDKLEAGIAFLRSETDDQNNDIIKIGPDGVNDADLDSILAHTDDVRDLFNGGYTVTADWDDDYDTPDEPLTINLGALFDDPIEDIKALLPAYTVSVDRDTVDYFYESEWDNALTVDTTIYYADDVNSDYYFNRSYYFYSWSDEYSYMEYNLYLNKVDMAFDSLKAELMSRPYLYYLSMYVYCNGTLTYGNNNVSATIYYSYEYKIPEQAVFVPVITWEAETFLQWILPDPTFNGLFPGMTDSEFKRIFGLYAEDWERTIYPFGGGPEEEYLY